MTSPVEAACPHRCCTGDCPGHSRLRDPATCPECLALPPSDHGPTVPKAIPL